MSKKKPDNEALMKAQDLMWTAFDTASKTKRINLAKQALELSPDCADAYLMLAHESKDLDRKNKIEMLEEAVKAGKRSLTGRDFKEEIGHYWLVLETRPFMRAKCALAVELEKSGRLDEAIIHYSDLLRLNPDDNQGIRYLLVPLYVSLDKLEEAEALLEAYPQDCSPFMTYSDSLLQFKGAGDTKDSRFALSIAVESNRHVVTWLLKPKFNKKRKLGQYITVGGEDEAYEYARRYRLSWYETEGAIEWLIENLLYVYEEVCCGDDLEDDDEDEDEVPDNLISFFDHIRN